jgi:hypothetical protein
LVFQNPVGIHGTGDKVFTKSVQGKIVERIVLSDDAEEIAIDVRFTDTTSFNVRLAPGQIQVKGGDVLGWKDGDSFVIEELL